MKIAIIATSLALLAGGAFAQAPTRTLPPQTQDKGGGTGPTSGGIGGMGGGKFGEPAGSASETKGVGSSLVRQVSAPNGRPAFGPGSSAKPMAHPAMVRHRMMHHKRMRHQRRHTMHHFVQK